MSSDLNKRFICWTTEVHGTSGRDTSGAVVTPRNDRIEVESGMLNRKDGQPVDHTSAMQIDFDPDQAERLADALTRAARATRKAIEGQRENELQRAQERRVSSLGTSFKELMVTLASYAEDESNASIFRDQAVQALQDVNAAYRLMAQNDGGDAKGTGYVIGRSDLKIGKLRNYRPYDDLTVDQIGTVQ